MNVILYGVCSGTLRVFQAVIVKYLKFFFYETIEKSSQDYCYMRGFGFLCF